MPSETSRHSSSSAEDPVGDVALFPASADHRGAGVAAGVATAISRTPTARTKRSLMMFSSSVNTNRTNPRGRGASKALGP